MRESTEDDDETPQFNTCPIYAEMYIGDGMANNYIIHLSTGNQIKLLINKTKLSIVISIINRLTLVLIVI